MLATLFLVAILIDVSQPAHSPAATYGLLATYLGIAAVITIATWRNWWLDAKLAGPAHAIDIVMFTLLVLLTEGYTSPVLTFFIFLLLAASIRWDWHATALTAILLVLLYLIVGMLVMSGDAPFGVQRYVVRTGHLAILSLILIWFGANQRRARIELVEDELLSRPSLDESPLEISLRAAMGSLGASSGAFLWRGHGSIRFAGFAIRDGALAVVKLAGQPILTDMAASPFLYDLRKNRALKKDPERNLVHFGSRDAIAAKAATQLALGEGLAIPVWSDEGQGSLFLDSIPGLSTDHVDLGEQIAADVATCIQRHSLLKAVEESAEARSRLMLARDLHDSVVQFLAGATFRLEAMKRSSASGRDFDNDLDELKQLMLQEQRELRSFISSLRGGPLVEFKELVKDLQMLATRLARQWKVSCDLSAQPAELMIPARLRLDAHQLMREAVANAVRHAGSRSITVELAAESDRLKLEFVNDGAGFPRRGGRFELPTSLKERVEEARGVLDMARGMGVTKLSISLPIGESRL